ncbi:hypothetical protein D9M73_296660 [compost metagenome]
MSTFGVTLTRTIRASPSFSGRGVHGLPSVVYQLRSTPRVRLSGSGAVRGMPATSRLANIGGSPCGVKRTPLASAA